MKKVFDYLKDIIESVVIGALIAIVLFNFVLFSAIVDGSSMYPTLENGQKGFSFIISRKIQINRFDICVIDTDKNEDLLVKRIIGLPNETIEFKDNVLYVNGEETKEDFLNDDVYTDDFVVTLKDNEYFCLGDNRQGSRDSRYYGPFASEEIKSTKFFVYYPFNQLGMK